MNEKDNALFTWTGRPKLLEVVPLSLQHLAAMVVGCVTPAIIVGGVAGLNANDTVILIQSALIIAGLATLLQLFPIFGKIGSGLPVIMGVSFAYLPSLIGIAGEYNIATILGAQIVGGVVAVIFGFFLKYLRRFFPPIITGTVVFTIGLSLYPTAINYMAGGSASANFGDPANWIVSLVTLAVVIVLNFFSKGFLKLASILIGIIIGYIVSIPLGLVDLSSVGEAAWLTVPPLMHFGLSFQPAPMVSMAILYVVNSVQAIGDFSATTAGGMDREPTTEELSGGIIANGISSIFGAFLGGLPTATFSQNVGIVTTNRVINRLVFVFASVFMLLAGFIPKFAAVLTTIPSAVLGGATVSVFATITMTGIKLITSQKMTSRNSTIVGLSVALGVGITQAEGCLHLFPSWVDSIFGQSPVVVATLFAIFLNLILPKEKTTESESEAISETMVEEQ